MSVPHNDIKAQNDRLGSFEIFWKFVSTVVPVYLQKRLAKEARASVEKAYLRNCIRLRLVKTMLVSSQSIIPVAYI